jgi:hypothetical protein
MLTIEHIRALRGILLSKRLTVTGDELPALSSLIATLEAEEQSAAAKAAGQQRVVPNLDEVRRMASAGADKTSY